MGLMEGLMEGLFMEGLFMEGQPGLGLGAALLCVPAAALSECEPPIRVRFGFRFGVRCDVDALCAYVLCLGAMSVLVG